MKRELNNYLFNLQSRMRKEENNNCNFLIEIEEDSIDTVKARYVSTFLWTSSGIVSLSSLNQFNDSINIGYREDTHLPPEGRALPLLTTNEFNIIQRTSTDIFESIERYGQTLNIPRLPSSDNSFMLGMTNGFTCFLRKQPCIIPIYFHFITNFDNNEEYKKIRAY